MIGLLFFGGLIIYFLLTVSLTILVVSRFGKPGARWLAGLLTVAVFILIPTWDEILGRMYFRHLCAAEGGVKVYKQVELPAEYWNEDGSPRFMTSRGELDQLILGNQYEMSFEGKLVTNNVASFFNIRKVAHVITVKQSNEVLGEYVQIQYPGGWLQTSTGLQGGGSGCPPVGQMSSREFIGSIFKPVITRD